MELRSPSAVIKYHRLGGLNDRTVLALTSGDWKSEVNMPTVLVSPEASLLGVQTAVFLCILGGLSLLPASQGCLPLCIRTSVLLD